MGLPKYVLPDVTKFSVSILTEFIELRLIDLFDDNNMSLDLEF